jgi:hypothetical protein
MISSSDIARSLALFLFVAACGEEADGGSGRPEPDASDDPRSAIGVGDTIRVYQLQRIVRTQTVLRTRATEVAEILAGVSLSSTLTTSWAAAALADPVFGKAAFPFPTAPEIEISYRPGTDMLRVIDRAYRNVPPDDLSQLTPGAAPDPGVGKPAAKIVAEDTIDDLIAAGGVRPGDRTLMMPPAELRTGEA